MTTWLNKQQMRRSFNDAAITYDQAADLQRDIGDLLLKNINDQNPGHKTILDLGSGTGYLSQSIQQIYPNNSIISLDIAENMLRISKHKQTKHPHFCADAENLCFANNTFDIIFSNMSLHWCQDIKKTFQEIHRILKSNGLLFFSSLGEKTLTELRDCWSTIDNKQHVNHFHNKEQLQQTLSDIFSTTNLTTKLTTRYHDSIYSLMKKLKAIGAHNVTTEKPISLTGKKKLQNLEKAYESFRNKENKLPATYDIILVECKK